jgi:hypothetical protein
MTAYPRAEAAGNVPFQSIHPPNLGGTCPNIPVICHDVPLWGFGGALWWTAPFFAAAVLGITRHTFSAMHNRPGLFGNRTHRPGKGIFRTGRGINPI